MPNFSTFFVSLSNSINITHLLASTPQMPAEFAEVEGGGSLILAWQIKNKNVLVVGGGEVSP